MGARAINTAIFYGKAGDAPLAGIAWDGEDIAICTTSRAPAMLLDALRGRLKRPVELAVRLLIESGEAAAHGQIIATNPTEAARQVLAGAGVAGNPGRCAPTSPR